MESLKLFTNDVFGEILVILKDNKEYFDANSVASLLGYSNPRDAIKASPYPLLNYRL